MSLFPESQLRIIESSNASLRLSEVRTWLCDRGGHGALIVSASRGAADDVARSVARTRRGAVGLHRFSFAQLAAHLAAPVLAARGIAPATRMGSEAVAARAAFDARAEGELAYFEPVSGTPGFPRALARTLQDLSLARVRPGGLRELPLGGADLAQLLERFEAQFAAAAASDRAALFEAAAEQPGLFGGLPLVLLDVPLESAVEFTLAERLIDAAADTLMTLPYGDGITKKRLESLGVAIDRIAPSGGSDLTALQRYLFVPGQPPQRERTGEVRLFSAPGEGRECVEIARRILEEARAGVPFDEIAVLVRSPREYVGLLEDAFDRARIPAWFDRGNRRPHPAGRAFLAILTCAAERLSAVRFAEYLSLGQVPDALATDLDSAAGGDELIAGFAHIDSPPAETEPEGLASESDSEDNAVVDGTLRAPWKWEALIVDSAVIGGSAARWERRLRGLRALYEKQLGEERRDDP
jgi:hypothetical protein